MTMLLLPVLITSSSSPLIQSRNENDSNYYDLCAPFTCGNITFNFPFSLSDKFGEGPYDCGLPRFQIVCDSAAQSNSTPSIELSGRLYQVKELFLSLNDSVITVVDHQLINDVSLGSCSLLTNLTIPITHDTGVRFTTLFLPKGGVNLTIFECPSDGLVDLPAGFLTGIVGNYSCGGGEWAYVWDGTQRDRHRPVQVPGDCRFVTLPISGASLSRLRSNRIDGAGDGRKLLADVLGYGFELQWAHPEDCASCQKTHGRCGYDGSTRRIVCFCNGDCGGPGGNALKWKVIVSAVAGSIFVLVSVAVVLRFNYKTKSSAFFKLLYWRKNQTTGDERSAKEFIKSYQSTLLTNYSYKDIKKMTSGFKEKLGKGGYGNVFKGEFSDGRLIAVKMLDNYKDNNNFLNEVNTIGNIRHFNIIRLLGFCWDGSKQALIYEYMPNKSLGDLVSNAFLGLPRLLEIAIGVAHGLEYLHNGCDLRILHLDIKPQNVLLDENFNPKISDFGLAKVFSRNRSAVTMTGARGTIGFIAPEIFMRNLGNPSHKSDVYSFGMLLLDMVGANKPVEPDLNTSSSEAYFPGWIHDKLVEERGMEFEDSTIVGEEVLVARKMVMVGLWCIQINPRDRPSMSRVIEMLSGDVEAIEMPPKPLFLSPPRLQLHDEIITSIESGSSVLSLTGDSGTKSNE